MLEFQYRKSCMNALIAKGEAYGKQEQESHKNNRCRSGCRGCTGYTAVCNQLFDFTVARKSLWSYGGKKKKDGKAKAVPLDRYGRIPEQDQEWLKNREQDELEICSTVDDTPLFGRYLRCENPKRIILCAHGYRTNS